MLTYRHTRIHTLQLINQKKMKLFAAIAALLLVSVVSAQHDDHHHEHPHSHFVQSLIERGNTLLSHAREIVHALREQGKGHLVQAIEHELVLVEALIVDLREIVPHLKEDDSLHHLHMIEETLLHCENRVQEEYAFILNHVLPHPHPHHTVAELIARGDKLIASAQEALKKVHDKAEVKRIEAELAEVQKLLATVKADPSKATHEAVEQLARHEHTLNVLIKRADH